MTGTRGGRIVLLLVKGVLPSCPRHTLFATLLLMTYSSETDYPSLIDIAVVVKVMLTSFPEQQEIDIDELVYDAISYWDEHFENDEDWFSEEDTDIKDSLRDQFLEVFNSN